MLHGKPHPPEPWVQEFIGGSPTFTAVDGSGTVVASKLTGGSVVAPRSGDGGFGSVGDLLLGSTSSRGTFRWALHEATELLAVRPRQASARSLWLLGMASSPAVLGNWPHILPGGAAAAVAAQRVHTADGLVSVYATDRFLALAAAYCAA